jgi:hypothetical protein
MGIRTCHTINAARRCGQLTVNWTRKARDGVPTTVPRILARFDEAQSGDILLLHDGVEPRSRCADRSATIESIAPLIEHLQRCELQPVRLEDLLELDSPLRGAIALPELAR